MSIKGILIIGLFLLSGAESSATTRAAELVKQYPPHEEEVKVCVSVHIAPGMWPPGMAAEADNDLSSFLSSQFFTLLRKDGIDPFTTSKHYKIVRSYRHQVCADEKRPSVTINYEYLPNGSPFRMTYHLKDGNKVISRTIEIDISKEKNISMDNKNIVIIANDIRSRALEIYPMIKSYVQGDSE